MDFFLNFILKGLFYDMSKNMYYNFFHSIINMPNKPIEKFPICCALILSMFLLMFIAFLYQIFKWMLKDEEKLFAELFWFVIDQIQLFVFYIIEKLRTKNLKLLIVLALNKCGFMRKTLEINVVNEDLTNNNIEDKLCDQLASENLRNQGFDDLSEVPISTKASDECSLERDDSSEDKEPVFTDSFQQFQYVDSFIYPTSGSLSTIQEEVSVIDSNDSVFAARMHDNETLDTNRQSNTISDLKRELLGIWRSRAEMETMRSEWRKGAIIEKENNLMMPSMFDSTITMAEKNKKIHLDKAKSSQVMGCLNKSQKIKTASNSHIFKSPKRITNYKKNNTGSNMRSISSQVTQTKLSVKFINEKSYYNVKKPVTNSTSKNDEEILAKKPKGEKSPDINANLQNTNRTVHVEPRKIKRCKSLDDNQHNKRSAIGSSGRLSDRSSDLSPTRSLDARTLRKRLSVNNVELVPHNTNKDKINPLNTPKPAAKSFLLPDNLSPRNKVRELSPIKINPRNKVSELSPIKINPRNTDRHLSPIKISPRNTDRELSPKKISSLNKCSRNKRETSPNKIISQIPKYELLIDLKVAKSLDIQPSKCPTKSEKTSDHINSHKFRRYQSLDKLKSKDHYSPDNKLSNNCKKRSSTEIIVSKTQTLNPELLLTSKLHETRSLQNLQNNEIKSNNLELQKLKPNTTIKKSNIPVASNNIAFQLGKSLNDLTFALETSIIEAVNDDSCNEIAQDMVEHLGKTKIKQQQQQQPLRPTPPSAHKQNQTNKNANATATASKKSIITIDITKSDDVNNDGNDKDYGKKLKKRPSLKQFLDKCKQNISKDKKSKTENNSTTSGKGTTISTTDSKNKDKRPKPTTSQDNRDSTKSANAQLNKNPMTQSSNAASKPKTN